MHLAPCKGTYTPMLPSTAALATGVPWLPSSRLSASPARLLLVHQLELCTALCSLGASRGSQQGDQLLRWRVRRGPAHALQVGLHCSSHAQRPPVCCMHSGWLQCCMQGIHQRCAVGPQVLQAGHLANSKAQRGTPVQPSPSELLAARPASNSVARLLSNWTRTKLWPQLSKSGTTARQHLLSAGGTAMP